MVLLSDERMCSNYYRDGKLKIWNVEAGACDLTACDLTVEMCEQSGTVTRWSACCFEPLL